MAGCSPAGLTAMQRDSDGVEMGLAAPDWLTPEIDEALAAITNPHAAKKQLTVLLVAQALATGQPVSAVFQRDDTCKADIWYGAKRRTTGKRKPGWKEDPAIATALHLATERARWWVRVKQGQAVQSALDILMDAGEAAAQQLANMVRMGVLVFDFGADGMELRRADVGHVLEASKQILDRVSAATATKATTEVIGMSLEEWRAIQKQRQAQAAQVLVDFADDE